jgi:PQQ-dependent catabolism-associated CXXCW motif protein
VRRRAAALAAATAIALALGSANAAEPEPSGYRGEPYKAPVPATLAGAEVLDDAAARALWESGDATFVDVLPHPPKPADLPAGTIWRDPPHPTIPGAVWLPDVGYEALASETLAYMLAGLEAATAGASDAPLVFFCKADCWMSWNAAKRALEHGYSRVNWYPGGVDGWAAAGWPLATVEPVTR